MQGVCYGRRLLCGYKIFLSISWISVYISTQHMNKHLKNLTVSLLALAVIAGPFSAFAAEKKAEAKGKPYPLKTCIVSDEKLGEMGDPFTFVYEGQEIKLCCKSCKKDFDKNPKKFLKKLDEAKAKEKK